MTNKTRKQTFHHAPIETTLRADDASLLRHLGTRLGENIYAISRDAAATEIRRRKREITALERLSRPGRPWCLGPAGA